MCVTRVKYLKQYLAFAEVYICSGYCNHPLRQEPSTWERSRCAQEGPSNTSTTLDLQDTLLLLPFHCLSTGEMLSVQHPRQGLAELLTHCWIPDSQKTTVGPGGRQQQRTLRVSALSLWVYTALICPWKGTWESWPRASWYQSTACPVPTMFQAQHHQLLQQSDCPNLLCTGAASLNALCVQT